MASSTRGKRSAAAAAATQETGTPAKVARVGGAEPAVKDKAKKKGENDHHLHLFAPTHGQHEGSRVQTIPAAQVYKCLPSAFVISNSRSLHLCDDLANQT